MTSPPKSTLDSLRSGLDKVKEITKDAEAVQQRLAEARVIADRMAVKSEPTPLTDEADDVTMRLTNRHERLRTLARTLESSLASAERTVHDYEDEVESMKESLASAAREREGMVERCAEVARDVCLEEARVWRVHAHREKIDLQLYAKVAQSNRLGSMVHAAIRALAPSQPQAPDHLAVAKGGEGSGAESATTWMIFFEDADMRPELFTDESAARFRLEQCRLNWSCHLFVQEFP